MVYIYRAFVIVLVVAAIAVSVSMIMVSLNPENYFHYGFEDPREWYWPWQTVALFVIFSAVEGLVFYKAVIFAVSGRLLVGLSCFTLLFAWAVLNLMTVMHQPIYYYHHLWWLLALNSIAFLLLLYGVGRKVCNLLTGQRSA